MPKIVSDFYLESIRYTAEYLSRKRLVAGKKIPDVKTIAAYENAMEEAFGEVFYQGMDKKDIVISILEDALKYGKWPKNYTSLPYKDIEVAGGLKIQQARFYIKNGIRVELRIDGKIIRVFPDDRILIEPLEPPKLKKWLQDIKELLKEIKLLEKKIESST